MVKLEKQFKELSLKKGQFPEIRITELEDLYIKLENMGSCITENQFMIHILNNLTSDYDLQLALMERRVGDADKPLIVEEVRGELNLRFERLNMKTSRNKEGEVLEEQALFSGQFKGKCRNCGQVGHKSFQCKNHSNHNGGNNGNRTGANFARTVANRTMKRRVASSSRRRKRKMTMPVILTVTLTGKTTSHKMWFSRRLCRTRS
jgi:hypothetical protein